MLIAGDASSNATFILFGRVAHRLIKKSVESLIEDNPPDSDYIPAEIAALVDSTFTWNVSFTRDTVKRSQESLQVNSIVSSGPSNEPLLLMPPGSSQEPSAIASASSSSSVQTGPQQSQTSSESQQLVQQGHSTSTPTKSPIGTPTQSTPTSKPSSSTPGKKNIVVSMCHMQPLSTNVDTAIKVQHLSLPFLPILFFLPPYLGFHPIHNLARPIVVRRMRSNIQSMLLKQLLSLILLSPRYSCFSFL